MINVVRELMEHDAALHAAQTISYLQAVRSRIIASYATLAIGFLCSFMLVFVALSLTDLSAYSSDTLMVTILVIAAAIVVSTEVLRSDGQFLGTLAGFLESRARRFRSRLVRDFMLPHYWLSLACLWLPTMVLILIIAGRYEAWIPPASQDYLAKKDTLNQIATFGAVLLGTQITLFTFALGSLLARYSTVLASTLLVHPAIVSVTVYALFLLTGSTAALFWGFPDSASSRIAFLGPLAVFCLLVSLWITAVGIGADRAVTYVGFRFSGRIRRATRKPHDPKQKQSSLLRLLSSVFGLSLWNLDRLSLLSPPEASLVEAERYLMGLFNAANRAVQDTQHEVFRASLVAVQDVAAAYAEQRRGYFSAQDSVFSFLNDQMAALTGGAAKAPNEHLMAEAVACTGFLGRLSFKIGGRGERRDDSAFSDEGHGLAAYWINLLKDDFYLSHHLMRSTAPSEVIRQLQLMAITSIVEDYVGTIRYSYLPAVKETHKICLTIPDAYHISIAGQAIRSVLAVWAYAAVKPSSLASYAIHKDVLQAIREMSIPHLDLPTALTLVPTFDGLVNVLTSRISMDRLLLQDVCLAIAQRPRTQKWQHRACADQLKDVVALIADIGRRSVEQRQPLTAYYGQALYEVGYFLLRGVHGLSGTLKAAVEDAVFDAWIVMVTAYYTGREVSTHEWQHPMFGLMGIAVMTYVDGGDDHTKQRIIDCARLHLRLVREDQQKNGHVHDEAWDYLQLLGAWISAFLNTPDLSKEVLDAVCEGRPLRYGFGGILSSRGSGRYSALGYPELLFGDFGLPGLRNIQNLPESEARILASYQERLISDSVLLPFAREVRRLRAELRKGAAAAPSEATEMVAGTFVEPAGEVILEDEED